MVGVEQADRARRGLGQHVVALQEHRLVDGDKIGRLDQVGLMDLVGTEAQMRHGAGARLLGVVDEVALGEVGSVLADDLDAVLVGADRAVGSQAVEQGAHRAGRLDGEAGINLQAGEGDVVDDAHGEVVLGRWLGQLVEDRLDHARRQLLAGEAVAAADGLDVGLAALHQSDDHVLIERLAGCAWLLGAVQHGQALDSRRQCGDEMLDAPGPRQMHLEDAHFFALADQMVDRLLGGLGGRAHDHHHPFGVGRAHVVEQAVLPAGQPGELVHGGLHDAGHLEVEGVDRLAGLEVDVGVLGGAAHHRVIGGEAAVAVGHHQLVVDHRADVVVAELLDLGDLVAGAEAVEEVDEGDACLQRGGLADQGEVHDLLHRVAAQHRPAGLAHAHHVAVVAEDRQALRGQAAGRHVEDGRRQLAGDLVHVGDHQQQALRRREGRGQGAGLQGAMHCARRAAFRLHLHHQGHGAPDVGLQLGRPLVRPFAHGAGGGDRIDGDHFVGLVGNVGRCLVAVDGDNGSIGHVFPILDMSCGQRSL